MVWCVFRAWGVWGVLALLGLYVWGGGVLGGGGLIIFLCLVVCCGLFGGLGCVLFWVDGGFF